MKTTTKNCAVMVFLLSILSLFFVGCAARIPNPEVAVREFWSAFKEGDYTKAAGYLAGDLSTEMVQANIWPEASQQTTADEFSKLFLKRIELVIKGHEVKNDTAIVHAEVNWPNMELFFGKFMVEAMAAALPAALAGVPQEQIDLMLRPIFMETLEGTPDVKTPHDIHLKLIDGSWKLTAPPIPDPEVVFNLSAFGKEDPTATKQLTDHAVGEQRAVPASKLNPIMGQPDLTGDIKVTVEGYEFLASIRDAFTGRGTIEPRGRFLVIYFSVTNNLNVAMQPSTQISHRLYVTDTQGRRWEAVDYTAHYGGVSGNAAVAKGYHQPEEHVPPGFKNTTAVVFDLPQDVKDGLALVWEDAGIRVPLK